MFQYITFRSACAVILSLLIATVVGKRIIRILQKQQVGEEIRDLGLEGQMQKKGTPTMGGVIILLAILVPVVLFARLDNVYIQLMIVSTIWLGLIGFLDDYIKIMLRRSEGLTPPQKMLGQFLVTGIFVFYLYNLKGGDMAMLIPFWPGHYLHLGWLAVPVAFLAIIGTVNGANFTDGLDGLASSVTLLIATFFSVVAIGTQSGLHPITCAVVGSLMGFLLFNVYPASVFMGDTGSLALGGFVASAAYMMDMPIFILIVALIYWVEILSVMIQVTYFKISGGKRIFRMAPIHHHFELCGWSETRVVAVFSIVTALLCLVGILAL